MKRIIYIAASLPLFAGCYNAERNCADFKTGKFRSELIIDGKKESITFERTDSLQIETFRGVTDTLTVRWVNDCECVLYKLHPKTREERKANSMRILTTKDNSYTFEFSLVGDNTKQKGTVTKID